jgi:hypothetical protein
MLDGWTRETVRHAIGCPVGPDAVRDRPAAGGQATPGGNGLRMGGASGFEAGMQNQASSIAPMDLALPT